MENERIIDDLVEFSDEVEDDSIVNGSSISFILEYQNKKLLFLADAHPDIILENLLKFGETHFDLVKLSHHGSKKNTTKNLAAILNSNLFLISTNGEKYDHPDLEALAKVLYYQRNRHKKLVFNYQTRTSNILSNGTLRKHYNYEIQTSTGDTVTIINL